MIERVGALRDRLADGIVAAVPGAVETAVTGGDRSHKIAGNCHVCFDGVESEALLFLLEGASVYASAASSCSSGAQEPSHVLAAMGVPPEHRPRLAAPVARPRRPPTTTSTATLECLPRRRSTGCGCFGS